MIVTDTITDGLDEIGDPVENAREVFRAYSEVIAEDARENAPWSDRTGDARAGIMAEVDTNGDEVIFYLAHSVEYGIWLETIQSGRFAILLPTLEKYSAQVFEDAGAEVIGVSRGFL